MAERLIITRIGHRGDGIAETPDGPVFVPYTLPGETVAVEASCGHVGRRRLLQVEIASADRLLPICHYFGVCGGCALQHWNFEQYRAWKRELVVTALAQAGLDAPVELLVDAHGKGRRRAVFHARHGPQDVLSIGFAAARTHHIVAIEQCPILAPEMAGAIKAAWAIAESLAPLRKPLDIQVTASESGLDVDARGSGPLTADESIKLAKLVEMRGLARLTRHGELVAQRTAPTLRIGRAQVALPPGAFLQPTEAGEAALAELVEANVGKAKAVADLFAGVGAFALRLAERRRVLAIDNDAAATGELARAAAATKGFKPVTTQVCDLFRRPLVPKELAEFDAVVFDPPRQGAQAQVRELACSPVPLIVAVSCNPATFARDARLLVDGGYRLARVTPVDQFRYSRHVELVARFERGPA